MHKRAFQGLKRTFMHVSGLPHHILIIKPSKFGGGRPETCVSGPETQQVRFRP